MDWTEILKDHSVSKGKTFAQEVHFWKNRMFCDLPDSIDEITLPADIDVSLENRLVGNVAIVKRTDPEYYQAHTFFENSNLSDLLDAYSQRSSILRFKPHGYVVPFMSIYGNEMPMRLDALKAFADKNEKKHQGRAKIILGLHLYIETKEKLFRRLFPERVEQYHEFVNQSQVHEPDITHGLTYDHQESHDNVQSYIRDQALSKVFHLVMHMPSAFIYSSDNFEKVYEDFDPLPVASILRYFNSLDSPPSLENIGKELFKDYFTCSFVEVQLLRLSQVDLRLSHPAYEEFKDAYVITDFQGAKEEVMEKLRSFSS